MELKTHRLNNVAISQPLSDNKSTFYHYEW